MKFQDVEIVKGNTESFEININEDITGWIFKFIIKKNYTDDEIIILEKTATHVKDVPDASGNAIAVFNFTVDDIDVLDASENYKYGIRYSNADEVKDVIRGNITILPKL